MGLREGTAVPRAVARRVEHDLMVDGIPAAYRTLPVASQMAPFDVAAVRVEFDIMNPANWIDAHERWRNQERMKRREQNKPQVPLRTRMRIAWRIGLVIMSRTSLPEWFQLEFRIDDRECTAGFSAERTFDRAEIGVRLEGFDQWTKTWKRAGYLHGDFALVPDDGESAT